MRYVVLDVCEKWGILPNQWRNIEIQDKMELIAKHQLEAEREDRIRKENEAD